MRAITSLSQNVTAKFIAISDTMGAVQATVNEHDGKLTSLETLCSNLQNDLNEQCKKLATSGVHHQADSSSAQGWILHKSDGGCGPSTPLPGSVVSGWSSPAALHSQTPLLPELILKVAAQKSLPQYNGTKLFIFPDLTVGVLIQRRVFNEVRKTCKVAALHYGFLHPSRFCVTVDGVTRIFNNPDKAERFLCDKLSTSSS